MSSDRFSIDWQGSFTFDAVAVYNATLTYTDGTTLPITAVIFRGPQGNTCLAPEFSANVEMAALEQAPIQSLTLDNRAGSNFSGLTADREA